MPAPDILGSPCTVTSHAAPEFPRPVWTKMTQGSVPGPRLSMASRAHSLTKCIIPKRCGAWMLPSGFQRKHWTSAGTAQPLQEDEHCRDPTDTMPTQGWGERWHREVPQYLASQKPVAIFGIRPLSCRAFSMKAGAEASRY